MIPAFNPVLDRLLAEPALVAQCGIEVSLHRGRFVEQVLRVSGDGVVRFRSTRSTADEGEEAIGTFEARLNAEDVKRTLTTLRETPLDQAPSKPADPRDVQSRVSVVGAGELAEVAFAVTLFAKHLNAWLQRVSQLRAAATKSPRSALRLEAKIAPRVRATQAAEITLAFVAMGTEGFWIAHLANLHGPGDGDEVVVSGGFPDSPESEEAGSLKLEAIPIHFGQTNARFLWLAAGQRVELKGTIRLPAGKGQWVGRASYSAYSGQDQVGGRPRLRGAVFSGDLATTVE